MKTIHKIKRFFGFNIPYSVILRDAKTRLLWDFDSYSYDNYRNGKTIYVCLSIHANKKQTRALREWIEGLLEGCISLESWLDRKHDINTYSTGIIYTKKIQETRHKWIDWMIQYWENEEFKERIRGIK